MITLELIKHPCLSLLEEDGEGERATEMLRNGLEGLPLQAGTSGLWNQCGKARCVKLDSILENSFKLVNSVHL